MSNKICSPVVVENPIIPAIASRTLLYNYQAQKSNTSFENTCCTDDGNSPTCRISTSTCSSSINTSSTIRSDPVKLRTYHSFNGKELALQFEKLQCTPDDHDTKQKFKKYSTKHSSALTLKAVKHQPLKKAVISKTNRRRQGKKSSNTHKFVLKPSKLNRCVKVAFNRSYADFYRSLPSSDINAECKVDKELSVYHDFSAACSKELETIELTSSTSCESSLRPRSSSLPAAGASTLETTSNSHSTSSTKNGNALEPAQHSSSRKSRRKHLSKGDLNVSKNDSNDHSISSLEPRITSRANKRRKSPPDHSMIGLQHSVGRSKGGREKSHDNLDASIDRLADYLEDSILLPKKMSFMAEMMYT